MTLSGDTWTWYARAWAVSQASRTRLIAYVAPRSTVIHCGSAYALPQRVVVLPSTALAAACALPGSTLDAVTGRPWARSVAGGHSDRPVLIRTLR